MTAGDDPVGAPPAARGYPSVARGRRGGRSDAEERRHDPRRRRCSGGTPSRAGVPQRSEGTARGTQDAEERRHD
jgi:hypothetical protein